MADVNYEFFSSLTIFLSSFMFIIMLLKLTTAIFRNKSNSSTLNLPPGPKKFPLIGNLNLFASYNPLHLTLRDLSMKYGPLIHLQLGEVVTIVVSSPEIAKEVMKTHDINFASRPSNLAGEIMGYGNTDIVFSPYGEYWRELRKICMLELLSVKRVESFRSIREEEFANLCRWIASNEGSPVNLSEKVSSIMSDVVARAAFGKKTEEQVKFISILKEFSELAAGFHIGDLYPSIKLFRFVSGMKRRMERLHQVSDRILGNIIDEHRVANDESNASKGDSIKHEDLVDVLLKFHDAGREQPLSMNNIKAVLLDVFVGGTETAATATTWGMAEMLKQPRILKKAQDEVRQVFDKKGCVDESSLHELNYLELVIKEALRTHPPAPLLVPRESSEKCEINGHDIPAKARVLVNAWAIGRDPRYWNEPESFEPERFIGNSVDFKGNNFEYIPFGAGRRVCPGISYGLANVKLPLAMFLYHFDWHLPDGMKPEELDMTDAFGISGCRENALQVVPVVKKPLPI